MVAGDQVSNGVQIPPESEETAPFYVEDPSTESTCRWVLGVARAAAMATSLQNCTILNGHN